VSSQIYWLLPSLVCGLTFFVLQLYSVPDLARLQIFDSAHYLVCADAIWKCLTKIGSPQEQFFNTQLAAAILRLDGPVMPFLGILATIIGGGQIGKIPLSYYLAFSGLFYCLTIALVSLVTYWLTKSKLAGASSGLFYALYLPAQAASCLFLTETPTAFLLSLISILPALSLAAIRQKKLRSGYLCAGVFGLSFGLLAMLKTALFPGVMFISGLFYLTLKKETKALKLKCLASMTMGCAAIFFSYAACIFMLTGHAEFFPSRDPAMNMAVGCDREVEAWECKPMPFTTICGSFQKPLITLGQAIKEDSLGFAALTWRKCLRSLIRPWIPARRTIWGIEDSLLRLEHCFLVACGLLGCVYLSIKTRLDGCFFLKKTNNREIITARNLAVISLVIVALAHFVFILFEAQPRYMFSAMPLFVMAAAVSLSKLYRNESGANSRNRSSSSSSKSYKSRILWFPTGPAIFLLVAISITAALTACNTGEPALNLSHRIYQFKTITNLIRNTKTSNFTASLVFSARDLKPDEELQLCLSSLDQKVKSSYSCYPQKLREFINYPYKGVVADMEQQVCRAKGIEEAGLWNWYVIDIPTNTLTLLQKGGKKQIYLSIRSHSGFYGQRLYSNCRHDLTIPALYYCSLSRLESSPDGRDLRPPTSEHFLEPEGFQEDDQEVLAFWAWNLKNGGSTRPWVLSKPICSKLVSGTQNTH
jgi:hypothetical protein